METAPRPSQSVAPAYVLVIEDSMIIAMDAEDCLCELGVGEVAIEGSVASALASLRSATPDLAVLDFNLGKESCEPVAAELARMGVPFWLATGDHEIAGRLDELGAAGMLTKPYGRPELEEMLAAFSALA